MLQETQRKKYFKVMIALAVVFALSFLIYLYYLTIEFGPKHWVTMFLFPMLLFAQVFLIIGYQRRSIRKGMYTDSQAVEFYKACEDRQIGKPNSKTYDECEEIYNMIFGTKQYDGKKGLLFHMNEIYNCGKEKKQAKRK